MKLFKMKEKKVKRISTNISWTLIALLLVIGYPLGQYIMWRKVIAEKLDYDLNGKILLGVGTLNLGYAFAYMGLIFKGIVGEPSTTMYVVILMLFAGSLASLIGGLVLIRDAKVLPKLETMVNHQGLRSLTELAEAYPMSPRRMAKYVCMMAYYDFFPGLTVDVETDTLVPKKQAPVPKPEPEPVQVSDGEQMVAHTIKLDK